MRPVIGKKHIELAGKWLPSAFLFGATSGLVVTYFTEWKAVLQYVPYYGGKYQE